MTATTKLINCIGHDCAECKAREHIRDVLELICDTASSEWQSSDGKLHGATDNEGKRLWFINREIMKEARAIFANTTTRKKKTMTSRDAVPVSADDLRVLVEAVCMAREWIVGDQLYFAIVDVEKGITLGQYMNAAVVIAAKVRP